MRITQYISNTSDISDAEQTIIEYLWNMEYDNLRESCTDDMTFDEFEEVLCGHIMGSVVSVLMEEGYNCDLIKDMYFDMTGKEVEEEVEEEEIDTSKLIFPKDITDAKICQECGEYDDSCGWASNENETYFTYCCRYCDLDGSKYNDWGECEKSNLYRFDKKI